MTVKNIQAWITAFLLLTLTSFVIYFQILQYPFVFDDLVYIVRMPAIRDVSNWRAIWEALAYPTRFIALLTFAGNYAIHELDVFGYHLINILIHVMNGLFVWWLMQILLSISSNKTPPSANTPGVQKSHVE